MSQPNDYTIGWICAIRTEYIAARAFLDEEHRGPGAVSPNDNNAYTLGKIGEHNVVIAVLPDGQYGISSAASVARDMMHSFPNIRVGLMVGIGGGAPSKKHDIRLGDIVVSAPREGKGGVFQYDFGKTIQDQSFRPTGFLNQPPAVLLTAVTVISGQYESDGHSLEEEINNILQKKPRLRKKYSRPDPSSDRLYQSEVVHPADGDSSCVAACGSDLSKLILRSERTQDEDNPTIHYGVIASGNQLMKDASVRDKLAAEENILCFEMEAAGLMNHFPCLVIRGICDYSDSHKNKEWQGYAAMVAAAYAKDLLCRIAPNRVETEKKIGDILSGLHEFAEEHRDIGKEHLQVEKDFAKERLSEKEENRDATYEWYKDRVEERHEHFQTWLKQESGPLLVTADPGCGKSVLAKYLIDHGLPRSTTICYFFFKDQDQNTLFSLKPSLIEHAMPQFRKDGQGLINSTESLWKILRNAIKDPQAGPVIVSDQFRSDQSGYGKLKYLLTCRPLLKAFPNIRIPGEEESETISQEVNRMKALSPKVKSQLEKSLRETPHRTYLWVYLVFNYLEEDDFVKTQTGVQSAIATPPRSINEAYEQILNRSKEHPMVRKALIPEMKIAVNIDYTSQSIHHLDLEDDEDFKRRLTSCIYFLHQTAREFLLADLTLPTTVSSELHWHHSITAQDAQAVLAGLCVLYLNFFNSNISLPPDANGEAGSSFDRRAFLDYSAQTWGAHFREAGFIDDAAIIPFALRICDPDSNSYRVWFKIYWETTPSYYGHRVIVKLLLKKGADVEAKDSKHGRTPLSWAAENGHEAIVKLLLEKGADVKSRDRGGRTPLSVKLLLEKGANVESKDKYGQTPLWWSDAAIVGRHEGARGHRQAAAREGRRRQVQARIQSDAAIVGRRVWARGHRQAAAREGRRHRVQGRRWSDAAIVGRREWA
ncbi:hypothetical protein B0J13DRAFT_594004 [Dactylonectria estremocensis]|uniref:Nucleoside phosphorylase domain-containing protein n=1 Tax=Dactylonectria estremocensis TaxID=1079267 RepID=A0A9P9JA10_9HYPO|nr:hypothetical protein B0J13DRAFT_594004 [Dactylonectria estremocensis]